MSDKDNNLSIEELLESLEKSKQAIDSELEAHHTQMVDYSQKETPRSTQELQVSQPAQTPQSVQPEAEAPKVSEAQPAAEILKVSEIQPAVEAPIVSEVQAVTETPKVTDNQPVPEMPKFDAVHGMPMFESEHTAPNKPEAVQGAGFVMTEPAAEILKVSEMQPAVETPKVSEVQAATETTKVSETQLSPEMPKFDAVHGMPMFESERTAPNKPEAVQGAGFVMTEPAADSGSAAGYKPAADSGSAAGYEPVADSGSASECEPAAPSPVPEDDSPFISVEPAVGSAPTGGYGMPDDNSAAAAHRGSTGGYGMPGDNSAAAAHRGSTGGYGMPGDNSAAAAQRGSTGGYGMPGDNSAAAAQRGSTGSYGMSNDNSAAAVPSAAPRSKASRRREKKPLQITKAGFVLSLILAMLLTSLLSFGAMAAYSKYMSGSDKEAATYTLSQSNDNLDYKSIIAKSQDAVVSIVTESVTMDLWAQNYVTQGAGSGVVIKENGYIITCNHVVEGAKKITVTLRNKKSYEAELVGADPGNDLAVLKIDAEGLSAAEYGDSSKLVMGDPVVAIGNPLGHLSDTASAGIISSLNRELSIEGQSLNLLQTDASINPGNSGGGLFNASGNLIGVVVAKSTGSDVEGLGFAIPINRAAKIASKIIKTGGNVSEGQSGGDNNTKSRVVIGINIVELSDQDAAQYGYESGGVFITGVTSSGAMEAGLQSGDKLEEVDGTKVENSDQLSELLSKHKAGDKVEVLVLRGQGEYRTTVTLSSTIDE